MAIQIKISRSLSAFGSRIVRASRDMSTTFKSRLKDDAKRSKFRMRRDVNTRSPGSRAQKRANPARIAYASVLGTSPNTDLGKLVASINSTVEGMRAEIGTVGAYENGIDYASYHEKNGRQYIFPDVPKFEADVRQSANFSINKLLKGLS